MRSSTQSGLKSFDLSRGMLVTLESDNRAIQMGEVRPPR